VIENQVDRSTSEVLALQDRFPFDLDVFGPLRNPKIEAQATETAQQLNLAPCSFVGFGRGIAPWQVTSKL